MEIRIFTHYISYVFKSHGIHILNRWKNSAVWGNELELRAKSDCRYMKISYTVFFPESLVVCSNYDNPNSIKRIFLELCYLSKSALQVQRASEKNWFTIPFKEETEHILEEAHKGSINISIKHNGFNDTRDIILQNCMLWGNM